MIVHIVLFKFKEKEKQRNILRIKEMLEHLITTVDVLKTIEVGVNTNDSERAYDMSLYATFEDMQGLNIYANDPEHLKALAVIKEAVETTKVVDYEK